MTDLQLEMLIRANKHLSFTIADIMEVSTTISTDSVATAFVDGMLDHLKKASVLGNALAVELAEPGENQKLPF